MANTIILTGRLGSDPKCTIANDGKELAKFTIACQRRTDRTKVDWFPCVIFGSIVPNLIKPHVKKGTQVLIKGPVQFNNYEAKDGTQKQSMSVIVEELELLGSPVEKEDGEDQEEPKDENLQPIEENSDDDLPF